MRAFKEKIIFQVRVGVFGALLLCPWPARSFDFGAARLDPSTPSGACRTLQACKVNGHNNSIALATVESLKLTCQESMKSTCGELENTMAAEDKKKLNLCDQNSVCEAMDLNELLAGCADGLVGFGQDAVEKFFKNFKNNADCFSSPKRKLQIIEDYNATVPDALKFMLRSPAELENRSCNDLHELLRNYYRGQLTQMARALETFKLRNPQHANDLTQYPANLRSYREWQNASTQQNAEAFNRVISQLSSSKVWATQISEAPEKVQAQISGAWDKVQKLLNDFGIRLQCYNRQARMEVACYAAAVVAATAVSGVASAQAILWTNRLVKASGSIQAARALAALEKLEKQESKLEKAVAGGAQTHKLERQVEKVAQAKDAALKLVGGLSDEDRLILAEAKNLFKGQSAAQIQVRKKAILAAHNVCKGKGYFEYSFACLKEKARVLKEAGFNKEERDLLMREGITGEQPREWIQFVDGNRPDIKNALKLDELTAASKRKIDALEGQYRTKGFLDQKEINELVKEHEVFGRRVSEMTQRQWTDLPVDKLLAEHPTLAARAFGRETMDLAEEFAGQLKARVKSAPAYKGQNLAQAYEAEAAKIQEMADQLMANAQETGSLISYFRGNRLMSLRQQLAYQAEDLRLAPRISADEISDAMDAAKAQFIKTHNRKKDIDLLEKANRPSDL